MRLRATMPRAGRCPSINSSQTLTDHVSRKILIIVDAKNIAKELRVDLLADKEVHVRCGRNEEEAVAR
jgi:RNA polymerase subunit RPABC4/transcription elongation factor Spt4